MLNISSLFLLQYGWAAGYVSERFWEGVGNFERFLEGEQVCKEPGADNRTEWGDLANSGGGGIGSLDGNARNFRSARNFKLTIDGMQCTLCRQKNRVDLLPKFLKASQKFPTTPMSIVCSLLGHSICGIPLRLYGFGGQGKIAHNPPTGGTHHYKNLIMSTLAKRALHFAERKNFTLRSNASRRMQSASSHWLANANQY